MKRYLLLVAIAGYFATPITAEHPDWFTDQADSAFDSPLDSERELEGDSAVPDRHVVTEQVVYAAFPLEEEIPQLLTNENGSSEQEGKNERPYHPVCDCGCQVPCLDHWSVCDMAYRHGDVCTGHPCEGAQGTCRVSEVGEWFSDDAYCDVWGPSQNKSMSAARLGWWAVSTDGSKQKTGEFQDLDSSPFWDVDALSSDGVRTWDINLTGLDDEANDAHIGFYSPGLKGKLDFQRYFRRVDHDPIVGLDLAPGQAPPATPEGNVIADDLNIGEDYAIRVEELDASAQGKLMDHVTWRMNVWSQRKFGERQSNAVGHCFNVVAPAAPGATGNVCHVMSERQTIDWTTVEVEPVIEAHFEQVTVEYKRTMRGFGQDDQMLDRQYTRFGFSPASGVLGPDFTYAMTPENFTQIDRLKVGANLTENNKLYANLFHGDTKNEFREMHREYSGYDFRVINSSHEDVKLTGYASRYDEETNFPAVVLDSPPLAPEAVPPAVSYDEMSLRHPVDYARTRAGMKGSWQPFGDRGPRWSNYGLWDGTSLASGYEYYLLERDFATYDTALGPFTQPDTKTHQIEFGPSTRWSRSLETYTRYKVRFIEDPLIGIREASGGFNTNQPEEVHFTEVGSTWSPTWNFVTTGQVSFFNSWHDSEFADFTENDYPMNFSVWYAPTHRLSFTSGYAYMSNWIDQDVTLGFTIPNVPVPPVRTETTRWSYWGENHLFSFNASYALTECIQLVGGCEWNRGTNTFEVPPSPAGADWSLLPSFADVIVETQRFSTGVDWQPYRDTNVYVRYIYFDYDDISADLYSGTAHMALMGATRTW